MRIGKEQQYRVTEFEHGIILTPAGTGLKMPDAKPLIIADRDSLLEYLGHYISLREAGVPFASAHEQAMIAAKIPKGTLLSG